MVHVFRLLLLLSLSLFSGQMYAAQNHESADTNYTASETFYKLTQHDYHALKVPYRAWNTRDAWSPDGYYRHLKRDLLGLLPCRRASGNDGELTLSVLPEYHLLVAFLSPSLLDIALKATPLPNRAQLSASKSAFHLPGWKQANLLYVSKHSREA